MHQSLSRKSTMEYVDGRQNDSLTSNDLDVSHTGERDQDWVDDIQDTLDETLNRWRNSNPESITSDQARDALEGELSSTLHAGLRGLPASILTDRDFWRFCAAYMYDYIAWRHQSSKTSVALYPYFGAASDSVGFECVPHRMFNRAMIALAGGGLPNSDNPYILAEFGARDLWASHILRVRTSYAPAVAHELLVDVREGRLPTDPVRVLAKNLKRVRSNVLFEVLDSYQARDLMDKQEALVTESLASTSESAENVN